MTELAEVAANPRIMPLGTSAAFAAGDGADFTIYRYRRARLCVFCQYPRRTVSAFHEISWRGQIIGAAMLCAACLARVIRARRAGRYLWGITAEQRRGITRLLANAGIHDPTPPLKKKHPREFSAPPSALEMMTVEEVEAANAEDRAAIRRRMKEWGIDFVINPNLARDFDWLYGGQRYAD